LFELSDICLLLGGGYTTFARTQ